MYKKILVIILVLFSCAFFCVPVFAQDSTKKSDLGQNIRGELKKFGEETYGATPVPLTVTVARLIRAAIGLLGALVVL